LLTQVIADGALVDEDGVVTVVGDQLDAREQTGGEAPVLVVEYRAHMNGAAACVNLIVDEVQQPLVWIPLFADQAHENWTRTRALAGCGAARRGAVAPLLSNEPEVGRLVSVEIGVDRVV